VLIMASVWCARNICAQAVRMCGIAGYVTIGAQLYHADVVERMTRRSAPWAGTRIRLFSAIEFERGPQDVEHCGSLRWQPA